MLADIECILENEPEVWLAYILGQQFEEFPHLLKMKPQTRGLFVRTLRYVLVILNSIKAIEQKEKCDVVAFYGTKNQASSINQTITELKRKKLSVLEVATREFADNEKEDLIIVSLSFADAMSALFLASKRLRVLHRILHSKHPATMSHYIDAFLSTHIYLIFFYRLLKQTQPKVVISANDHSPPNRCLYAVASHLGIKTAYLQHASVSTLFPALDVNYAFLDGEASSEVYKECVKNARPNKNVEHPKVILSGQKKRLLKSTRKSKKLGIAINEIDTSEDICTLIDGLIKEEIAIILRWHPGMSRGQCTSFIEPFGRNSFFELSDPEKESISHFMMGISWLVAGNSSIHLEAALSGVKPIYFEITSTNHPDYYGYVKHGLAEAAHTVEEIIGILKTTQSNHGINLKAVQYYSATFGTEWEGREGELVAQYIAQEISQ